MCGQDNVEAELDAIVLLFQMAKQHFTMYPPSEGAGVTIISDCRSAIAIVCKQADIPRWLHYFLPLWKIDDELKAMKVKVALG